MATPNKIEFTEEEVKKYLDRCIRHWRKQRDGGIGREKEMAVHYIDAFQSVRMSLFDELLPR